MICKCLLEPSCGHFVFLFFLIGINTTFEQTKLYYLTFRRLFSHFSITKTSHNKIWFWFFGFNLNWEEEKTTCNYYNKALILFLLEILKNFIWYRSTDLVLLFGFGATSIFWRYHFTRCLHHKFFFMIKWKKSYIAWFWIFFFIWYTFFFCFILSKYQFNVSAFENWFNVPFYLNSKIV